MAEESPLNALLKERGGLFAERHGWLVAVSFGDENLEYDAIRNGAGALDLSFLGKLRVVGHDRVRFLHSMLSNDIRSLQPGSGCHAALLTPQGKIESDLYAYCLPDEFLIECPPAGREGLLSTLGKHIIGDAVEIEDLTSSLCILSVQGPGARAVVEETVRDVLTGRSDMEHKSIQCGPDTGGRVICRDRTGFGGYDLWISPGEAARIWQVWAGRSDVCLAGMAALNMLRSEAGIPWFGEDMDSSSLPMEFNLRSAISTNKGCYRGQEIVARILHRGRLGRGFCAIALEGAEPPEPPAPVMSGGGKIGRVTSAVRSPALGRILALAVLDDRFRSAGTRVEVLCGDAPREGKVIDLPVRPV